MFENSNMDSMFDPAATANNYPLVSRCFDSFANVDRLGLELVPQLSGTSRRPTGHRGGLLWFRTGSNIVVPPAFRILSIPNTA
jgi:predicted phage gp36 major capsid-like protein